MFYSYLVSDTEDLSIGTEEQNYAFVQKNKVEFVVKNRNSSKV